MKKCYSCGAEVPDDAKFCAKCGKPLEITQDLIDRAKAGDSAAQTELYQRTYKIVYAKTRAKISDEDAVMDIMQETYLRAFTNLDQLKKAETFPSWLLTIASRQACDWYRKNGKEQQNIQLSQLEYEDDDTFSDEDDLFDKPEDRSDLIPDEALDRAETGRLLSEILDTLPEDQRLILTMFYYDDMSLNEISEELGVNLSTVKSRLTAGKKKVKAKVLELEKSGTKLYSLGPVAFLVYLLHHAELFAPEIPTNTILGLAGTGAAAGGASAASVAGSAAAGGASAATGGASAGSAASHVAAGAAAKTAVAAAAKGVSMKAAIAIIAAAAVVAGGSITTASIISNSPTPEPVPTTTAAIETSGIDETTVIEAPSTETVMDIANYFAFTGISSTIESSDDNDWIEVTFEDACDAAAAAAYKNNEGLTQYPSVSTQYPSGLDPNEPYVYEPISEETVSRCLRNLFGSKYQLSDYTRSEPHSNDNGYSSDYQLIRSEDGYYWVTQPNADDGLMYTTAEVLNITSETETDEAYIAKIRYSYYIGDLQIKCEGYRDITFRLTYDEGSDYRWVITAFKYGSFIPLEEEETGKIIKSMTVSESENLRDADGGISYNTSKYYTYDRDGNLLTETFYGSDGNEIYRHEYTYDDNGNMVTSIEDNDSYRYEYAFDDNGNVLTCTKYNDDGSTYSQTEYTYDDNSNILTETTNYNREDSRFEQIKYTYDSEGNMISKSRTFDAADPDSEEYTYDSDGKLQTRIYFESDGIDRYEYAYDSKGNLLTETDYLTIGTDDEILYKTVEYTYDDFGNTLTETTYDSDGLVTSSISYEYEYYE